MSEQIKAITRRFTEEVWNKGNLAVIDELVAPGHIDHPTGSGPDFGQGPDAFKKLVTMYRTAFPDTRFTIEDQIAEGDKVMTRWTARGTQKGELLGIAPTGRKVTVTGFNVDRIVGGKIVESWGIFDALGMMQQLGVVPPLGQASTR